MPVRHVDAPTPVSVMLAGVLLKMGTYALLRFNFTMMPDVAKALVVPLASIAVISVIYGAILALAQQDLKRIVAYSSISSMGYVILGLVAYTTYGVGGATFQMIAHGLISGLMFMVSASSTTRRTRAWSATCPEWPTGCPHARHLRRRRVRLHGTAADGWLRRGVLHLPGRVRLHSHSAMPLFTAAAMFGIVIVAGYLLFAMQRTLFGPFRFDGDYEITKAPIQDIAPLAVLAPPGHRLGVAPDLSYRRKRRRRSTRRRRHLRPTSRHGRRSPQRSRWPSPLWCRC